MIEIKSLENTSLDELFETFSRAFADYEMQLDKTEHLAMLQRRGYDPRLSFAAFDGDKIVSFTCNGTGDYYEIPTAYDTGTGTLKDHRGQGLATRIFQYSIPYLRQAGIRQYLLEVLQHNTGAVSVYSKLGFEVTREFYYYRTGNEQLKNHTKNIDFHHTIKPIDINEHPQISTFWDFKPSWQNSTESINRAGEAFICLGVFSGDKLIGYGVFEPSSGDVTQLAVDRPYRRKGIGSLLLDKMLESNKLDGVKIINIDIKCDSVTAFLKAKNIEPTGKQFEMIKVL